MVFFRKLWRITIAFASLPIPGVYALFLIRKGGWHAIEHVTDGTLFWSRMLASIFHLRVRVHGDARAFQGGLIVSNHLGYWDIFSHASVFKLRFTPKKEIRSWPFLGWYLGLSKPVWVDRGNRRQSAELVKAFQETMDHGVNLLVYPEGTSTSGEEGILPFKSTPFEAVAEKNYPILPVLTVYCPMENNVTMAWYGEDTLLPHVWNVIGQKNLFVDLYLLPVVYPEKGESRKELASRIHTIMSEAYEKIKMKKDGDLTNE